MKDKTYPQSGSDLYDFIVKNINHTDKIEINMDGVISLPSMFLNMSIGSYIEDFGYDSLSKKVFFSNISTIQAERLKDYISKIRNTKTNL